MNRLLIICNRYFSILCILYEPEEVVGLHLRIPIFLMLYIFEAFIE